jgi:glycosyltransferase involved in cell wall biosynthesis
MRFVVVQETDWLTRGPHQQHHLFERLAARGHAVTVLDFEIQWQGWPRSPLVARRQEWPSVSRVGLQPPGGVRVIRPATLRLGPVCRPSSVITHAVELNDLIRREQPDVLVNYALSTGLAAEHLARRWQVPFVMHVIDALHTLVPSRLLQPLARAVEARLLRRADRSVFINDGLRDYALGLGAPADRAVTLRTGVDLDRIRPEADGRERRRAWGLAPDDVVLLFMGWLYPFAGLFELLAALPAAPERPKLLIVGDGEAEGALRHEIAKRGLQGRVVMTGRQPYEQMPEYLAAADICLLPSQVNEVTRHIVPVKIYEYLASGRPVIASRLPGVMRDLPEGEGVCYAAPGEHLQVAAGLMQPEARRALGAHGRAFVEAHCDWNQITSEFEALLIAGAARAQAGRADRRR